MSIQDKNANSSASINNSELLNLNKRNENNFNLTIYSKQIAATSPNVLDAFNTTNNSNNFSVNSSYNTEPLLTSLSSNTPLLTKSLSEYIVDTNLNLNVGGKQFLMKNATNFVDLNGKEFNLI
jgi:hypothetical protein